MSYGIWLSFNNQEEGFQIPVNPGSIEISDGSKGKTYDVAGLGEINVIKDMKLTEYTFSSIFPVQRYPFITSGILLKPKKYTEYLLKWMKSNRPIRFVFTGDSFNINEAVSIEQFDRKEVAGGGGDIEYTLKLKKYVFYTARRADVIVNSILSNQTVQIQKQPPVRPDDRQLPQTYTLISGDNLWTVAQKIFGNGARWKEIQQLNNISDAQLKNLQVGMVLKLPEAGTAYV